MRIQKKNKRRFFNNFSKTLSTWHHGAWSTFFWFNPANFEFATQKLHNPPDKYVSKQCCFKTPKSLNWTPYLEYLNHLEFSSNFGKLSRGCPWLVPEVDPSQPFWRISIACEVLNFMEILKNSSMTASNNLLRCKFFISKIIITN